MAVVGRRGFADGEDQLAARTRRFGGDREPAIIRSNAINGRNLAAGSNPWIWKNRFMKISLIKYASRVESCE